MTFAAGNVVVTSCVLHSATCLTFATWPYRPRPELPRDHIAVILRSRLQKITEFFSRSGDAIRKFKPFLSLSRFLSEMSNATFDEYVAFSLACPLKSSTFCWARPNDACFHHFTHWEQLRHSLLHHYPVSAQAVQQCSSLTVCPPITAQLWGI